MELDHLVENKWFWQKVCLFHHANFLSLLYQMYRHVQLLAVHS